MSNGKKGMYEKGIEFLVERIKESRANEHSAFQIIGETNVGIIFKQKGKETKKSCELIFANAVPLDFLQRRAEENKMLQRYTAPILYADDRTALAPLHIVNPLWNQNSALQKYNIRRVKEMIVLTPSEKFLLSVLGQTLPYYQSETSKASERITGFYLKRISGANIGEKKQTENIRIVDEKWSATYDGISLANGLVNPYLLVKRGSEFVDTSIVNNPDETYDFF